MFRLISPLKKVVFLLLVPVLLLILSGCSGTEVGNPDTPGPSPSPDFDTFGDNRELETYLKDQYAKNVLPLRAYSNIDGAPVIDADAENDPGLTDSGRAPGYALSDFSQTNVQEAGVDESDVIKTDGQNFFISRGKTVCITTTEVPMQTVATIDITGTPGELYRYKDLLVVLYTPSNGDGEVWNAGNRPTNATDVEITLAGLPYCIPIKARTGIALYNVADPAVPQLIHAVEVDGYLVSSRRIGEKLHLVQQYLPELPPIQYWYDDKSSVLGDIVARNRELLTDTGLANLIPFYRVVFPGGGTGAQAVLPENFYKPVDGDRGGAITTIVTFDLDKPEAAFKSVGLVADANEVYASTEALYIFCGRWIESGNHKQGTDIHKIDITGETALAVGTGHVNGWILNQFSAGEYDGVLRVATTTSPWDGVEASTGNHIYCLTEKSKTLSVEGKLENLAIGEKIYSARFIGERGFLVTFKRVDPLFTLDLSNSTAPRVMGELKVPGYSDYIHPWGENHLITIGKMVTEDERGNLYQQGVKLSVFEISSFDRPVELDSIEIGERGTDSQALYNHKALTFHEGGQDDLLALPIDLYERDHGGQSPMDWGHIVSSGLHVYRMSKNSGDAFEPLGVLATQEGLGLEHQYYWTRGVIGNQRVYALTPHAVHTALVADIVNTIETFTLPEEE